jgi:hypothetical protein
MTRIMAIIAATRSPNERVQYSRSERWGSRGQVEYRREVQLELSNRLHSKKEEVDREKRCGSQVPNSKKE